MTSMGWYTGKSGERKRFMLIHGFKFNNQSIKSTAFQIWENIRTYALILRVEFGNAIRTTRGLILL